MQIPLNSTEKMEFLPGRRTGQKGTVSPFKKQRKARAASKRARKARQRQRL